jgi:hypothetical protein
MRGNSYLGKASLPQAANDPGQAPAPQRRTFSPPINDNRPPLWQQTRVRWAAFAAVIVAGGAWYYQPFPFF